MKRLSDVADDRLFYESMLIMQNDLANTIRKFLIGSMTATCAEYWNPTLTMASIGESVREAIQTELLKFQADPFLDPRLRDYVGAGSLFEQLDRSLSALYPALASETSQHSMRGKQTDG
jgi:hypothetical protein